MKKFFWRIFDRMNFLEFNNHENIFSLVVDLLEMKKEKRHVKIVEMFAVRGFSRKIIKK